MTENNSNFTQESDVGNSANVRQESEQKDIPSENRKNEDCIIYNEMPKVETNIEEIQSEDICSKLTNSGCEDELHSLQDHWMKLSTFFRKVYHTILDGEKPPDEYECHVNIVRELVASDPHQLFARLEMDLQEFIIEVKLRQMELLNCVHTHEGPQLFIFCLIESYNKLMFAANTLSPLLLQLEVEHLANFNITWRGLNQHLFHKLVFTEPKIQKVLPVCISKLGKMNSKLSDFNKRLIRQFLTFDGEMLKIGGKWREAESAIIKYHQENSMLDAKQRMMKVNWELIKTQTKVFHEELKSSGLSSDVGPDILNNSITNSSSSDECSGNFCICDADKKSTSDDGASHPVEAVVDILKNMKVQKVCDFCLFEPSGCTCKSFLLSPEEYKEMKTTKSCSHSSCDTPCEDTEILAHLNADGKKMYSHLHKFKAQQTSNGSKTQRSVSIGISQKEIKEIIKGISLKDIIKDTSTNVDNSQNQPNVQVSSSSSSSVQPSAELHKTLIRKQVIHQQRQQHQKKIIQMMQSSQQKDIQHKIQKQLQEHQLLLQQQRKIDELHAHLLQQHPMHMDKEMQMKVHLQMQQRLMQKHKQMEEKFHQQVQQHLQQHQEKQSTSPSTSPKANANAKSGQSPPNVPTCNHSTKPTVSQKTNQKCTVSVTSTTATNTSSAPVVTNSSTITATSTTTSSSKTVTVNVSTTSNGVTHKNSTTQTTVTSGNGQNRVRHHPLPDVVKSASYICPKHSEGCKQNMHNHGEHDNSSENSSDEDYSSERSNSPQRHCDCCYCEVFGSAPVSRNFQETRERLRLILTKKKAKTNATPDAKLSEDLAYESVQHSDPTLSASQGGNKIRKDAANAKKVNADPGYKGDKSIEEILDFIEGTKNRNMKRMAKKLRRKQRQIEEEERKRKEEEAERLRLEELRRKEEEEKKRLEEERRRQELLEQNRKKNKKKGGKQANQQNTKYSTLAANQSGKKGKNNKIQSQLVNDKSKNAQIQRSNQEQGTGKNSTQKQTVSQKSSKLTNQTQKKQSGQKQEVLKQQSKQKPGDKQKQTQQPTAKNNTQKKGVQQNQQQKGANGSADDSSGQPKMVTIKRVMQPNSSEPTVTITLRGPTPKEDKVLYTLLNGQMCQAVKEDKNKKQTPQNNTATNKSNKPSGNVKTNVNSNPNITISSVNPPTVTLKNTTNFNRNFNLMGNGVNNITERMERLKLGPQPVSSEPAKRFAPSSSASPAELMTPTAIQINQAVNQLSSRPTFPNNFDLENIKLPPGITITKVDPATVQRKPIQMKQQPPPPPPPQTHVRQSMMSSVPSSSNVIVVDTNDKNNFYQSEEQISASKKKRRRRKKESIEGNDDMVNNAMPYGMTNGLPPRMGPIGNGMFGNPFMNAGYGGPSQQPAAIIQMNGSMVTIRNPALHQALSGQPMEYQDGTKAKKNVDVRNSNVDENNMFASPPEEIENGDVDEYEHELEAFKRFCSQSVPAESKPKVNLNIKDIVLKKKGPVIGCS